MTTSFDDLGAPVGGIRARAFAKLGVGARELSHAGEDFSRTDTGMWELTLNTDTSPTGLFTIEMYNPSTGQVRWRDGHVRLQVEALIGPHGNVPIPDQSVSSAKIQDGAITDAKINNGALSSIKLQNFDRTVDQNIGNFIGNTGSLGQMLSLIGKQIRNITGTADWKSVPPTNLSAVYNHMQNGVLHSSGVNLASANPMTTGYNPSTHTVKMAAGAVSVITNLSLGQFYVNTPTPMNGLITIIFTHGNAGAHGSIAVALKGYEQSFPDSTVLLTFQCNPNIPNGTNIRVNYLVIYY